MLPRSRFALAVSISIATVSCCVAAELGDKFDSYRDLHEQTQYGTLFFNATAIRPQDNRWKKRFAKISGVGELSLPSQEGYCFVFNHYGAPTAVSGSQGYRLKISRVFTDGRAPAEQMLAQDFTPTDSVVSPNLPDWCVAGTLNVSKMSLEFSSDDGYFNRMISFPIK